MTEQTELQAQAIRALMARMGVPTREQTWADGTRVYEFRVGTIALRYLVSPSGELARG